MKFKTQPFEHQLEALEFLEQRKRTALFMEMGTGKSKVVLDFISRNPNIRTVLVIVPKTIIFHWKDEIKEHSRLRHSNLFNRLAEKRLTKLMSIVKLPLRKIVFLINYEGFLKEKTAFRRLFWDLIILDESTKIKNHRAKVTKLLGWNFSHIPYKIIMTGTPITQSYMDIFSQILFLDDGKRLGKRFSEFREKYFDSDYMGYKWELKEGAKKEIKKLLKDLCFFKKKKDCLSLPSKLYEKITLDMGKKQGKLYREMRDEFLTKLEDQTEIETSYVVVQIMKLSQITSGFIKDDNKKIHHFGSEKEEALVEILDGIGKKDKVIIWARFIHDLFTIKKLCNKLKRHNKIIYGKTSNRERKIKLFKKSKKLNTLICQVKCLGYGVNLSEASIAIYYSNSFSLENRLQSEDRIHRIGTKKKVTIIDLVIKNSIDEKIYAALKGKKKVLRNFMDRDEIRNLIN